MHIYKNISPLLLLLFHPSLNCRADFVKRNTRIFLWPLLLHLLISLFLRFTIPTATRSKGWRVNSNKKSSSCSLTDCCRFNYNDPANNNCTSSSLTRSDSLKAWSGLVGWFKQEIMLLLESLFYCTSSLPLLGQARRSRAATRRQLVEPMSVDPAAALHRHKFS